jgi:hypothetical protein
VIKGLMIFTFGIAVGAAATVALTVTGIIKAAREGDVNVTIELPKDDALILADEAKTPSGEPVTLSKDGATVTCSKDPGAPCQISWSMDLLKSGKASATF